MRILMPKELGRRHDCDDCWVILRIIFSLYIYPYFQNMKQCPFCWEEIHNNAIKCKHCWERLETQKVTSEAIKEEKKINKVPGCLVVLGICFWIIVFLVIIGKLFPQSDSFNYVDICIFSETKVKELLKSPSSAQFADCDENNIIDEGSTNAQYSGHYQYTSYVDAQNWFWAMIRNNYSCDIRDINKSSDPWTYNIYCKLNK